jgi:hypothetical protein
MKVTIKVPKEVNITHLKIVCKPVNEPDGNPGWFGDTWNVLIDLEYGVIQGWRTNNKVQIHYKVSDGGNYRLLDEYGNTIFELSGVYVPDVLQIDKDGWGDYITMTVNEDGRIENFNPKMILLMFPDEELC